jgi:hypothetical protein
LAAVTAATISSIGAPAGITTVSIPADVGTSNSGVLACGGMPASKTASFAGEQGSRRSSRACMRHARHAIDT